MTKRILYPIVFALLLLLGGWGNKASGQSSGATYVVRYTLPKGVSDLRCVTYLPSEGKVVVTPGRKLPAGAQMCIRDSLMSRTLSPRSISTSYKLRAGLSSVVQVVTSTSPMTRVSP